MTELERIKYIGTNHPRGIVDRSESGLFAAWRIGEAQVRRSRPLQDRPCQRLQGRRRSRDELCRRRHTAVPLHITVAMAEAMALGANSRVFTGFQKIHTLDPRDGFRKPATTPFSN